MVRCFAPYLQLMVDIPFVICHNSKVLNLDAKIQNNKIQTKGQTVFNKIQTKNKVNFDKIQSKTDIKLSHHHSHTTNSRGRVMIFRRSYQMRFEHATWRWVWLLII